MTPTPAQIAAAQCNFVNELVAYNNCKKYNIDCCSTKVEEAFYLKKLAESGCDLDYDLICQLDHLNVTIVDCTQDPTCEEMADWSIKQINVGGDYSVILENEYDYSNKFVFNTNNNSTLLSSTANVVISNGYGEVLDSYSIAGGCKLVNGVSVCSDIYKTEVYCILQSAPLSNFYSATSSWAIQSIRLWNVGTATGTAFGGPLQYQDVDISPSNIWPARPGSTAALPADLLLSSPNLASALKKQIENFVWAIDSSSVGFNNQLNIKLDVSVVGDVLYIKTVFKHNPTSSWWGLRSVAWAQNSPYDLSSVRLVFPGDYYKDLWHTTYMRHSSTKVYDSHAFTNDCAQTSNVVVEGYITPYVNYWETDLNKITLQQPTQQYSSKVDDVFTTNENLLTENILSCYKTTLIPTVNSTYANSVSWYSPSGTLVGSGSVTLTNPVQGTYTAKLTLVNTGCVLEKTIEI